jgi:hypothetical protein
MLGRLLLAVVSARTAFAGSDAMIQVALAPPVDGGAAAGTFQHFGTSEAAMESQGLAALQKAMSVALSRAQGEISAAIHGGSFLRRSSDDTVFVRVMSGPQSASTARAAAVEGVRSNLEGKVLTQAAAEFDSLTKVVVGELRRALRSSFLQKGPLNVKVKASDIPWVSSVDLLRSTESARDASEAAMQSKVLSLQIQFAKALNAMIARALA